MITSWTQTYEFTANTLPLFQHGCKRLAEWTAEAFFKADDRLFGLAKMGRPSQGGHIPQGYQVIVGYFTPSYFFESHETWAPGFTGLTMPRADKRLYIQSGDSYMESLRGQVDAWRNAVHKAMTWPGRYQISENQALSKIGEQLQNWMLGKDADWLLDPDNYALSSPTPHYADMATSATVYMRLGNPTFETRQFTLFQKRRPRKFGRSALPKWLEIHEQAMKAKKFTRQTKKLIKDPNANGFGKSGTEEWKDKALRKTKEAVVRIGKDAINKAVDVAVEEGGKRVVRKVLKKALGDKLGQLERYGGLK